MNKLEVQKRFKRNDQLHSPPTLPDLIITVKYLANDQMQFSTSRATNAIEMSLLCGNILMTQLTTIAQSATQMTATRIDRNQPHYYDGDLQSGRGCGICGKKAFDAIHTPPDGMSDTCTHGVGLIDLCSECIKEHGEANGA